MVPPDDCYSCCLRRSVDVSGTDYHRASARSIGGLTMAVSSKSRIPKPSPGGRWHGVAMTDEGKSIEIYQIISEAASHQKLVFGFPSELVWSFSVAFPSSAPVCALGHLPPRGRLGHGVIAEAITTTRGARRSAETGELSPPCSVSRTISQYKRNKTPHNRKQRSP